MRHTSAVNHNTKMYWGRGGGIVHAFFTLALVVVSCEIITPTALSPGEKPTESICKDAGWTPVSVDTVENWGLFSFSEIEPRFRSSPVHRQSLYWMILPAPYCPKIIERTDDIIFKWEWPRKYEMFQSFQCTCICGNIRHKFKPSKKQMMLKLCKIILIPIFLH